MSNPFFQFKQFTIRHDKCAMTVGTDGVLLGAWAGTESCNRILDIGTGTGLIALMLAQRSKAAIDAIDIEADACLQAQENAESSLFAGRINVFHSDLVDFAQASTHLYDLIVSNPPYFVDSLKCPNLQRNTARHTDTLTLEDLLQYSRKLLAPQGRIALILPYDQKDRLTDCIQTQNLFLSKEVSVIPVPDAQPKRLLAELTSEPPASPAFSDRLTIEIARHRYTDEYINLTKDFYLKM